MQGKLATLCLALVTRPAPASADCPAGSFTVSAASREAVAKDIGRIFYTNDMCGVDAGSASASGAVDVTTTSTGRTVRGGTGSEAHVGALSGGGAGCNRRLEMMSWPAGGDDFTITTIAQSSSTVGGAVDYIGGPAIDQLRGHVYYIRTDVNDDSKQVLERYDYNSGETVEVYRNTRADFPTPPLVAAFPATFHLTFDVNNQILYWFVRQDIYRGPVMQLALSSWSPGNALTAADVSQAFVIDEEPPLGGATVMTDWFAMQVDCHGDLYIAFYKKISKWTRGGSTYTDFLARSDVEDPVRCVEGLPGGGGCQIHALFIDDAAQQVYYGYSEGPSIGYTIRRIGTGGDLASDESVIGEIYYERPDSPQYIATFTADLVNRDFYVIGYAANSGGRSLYRVPMDHPTGTANLFGYAAGDDMRYMANGEKLMAGNCGAADYAEGAPGVGAGMTDHCAPGSIQRYPAAGSGTIVAVPPNAPSGSSCPERPAMEPVVGKCGANAVPETDPDRHIFYDFDHRLGWPDLGASELREMTGPGTLAWCGFQPDCYPTNNPFSNDVVNMTQVDYSPHYAIVGSSLDLERGYVYYTKCTAGVCLWRSDTTGECLERINLPGACGEWALMRYSWRTREPPQTLWQASAHDFPGPMKFLKDSFTMTLDPHRQIIYYFVQYLNKDGYGYIVSMDVSNVDNEPLTHCSPKVELYIKGSQVDNTRHVRGGWIDLLVDCEGVLWMSNLVKIWKYDPLTMYDNGEDTREAVISTDIFGCANSMSLTDCQIRGIGLDDVNRKIYYSYVATTCSEDGQPCLVVGDDETLPPNERAMIATQLRSINMDGTDDTLVYRAVFYERSGSGPWDASYFGSFTLDLANRDFYVSTYKGNSAERSIIRLTMDPETLGQNVYLYGHPSIPHSMIGANVYADYMGPDRYLSPDGETVEGQYEVVVPKYGMTRYYAGSVPIGVVPGASTRVLVDNPLADYFDRIQGNIASAGFVNPADIRIAQSAGTCFESPMQQMNPAQVECEGNYVTYTDTQTATSASDMVADCALRCTNEAACESFSFSQAGQCYLWSSYMDGFSTEDSCSCMQDTSCDEDRRLSCTYRNVCEVPGYGPSNPECTSFTCNDCTSTIAGHWERRVDRDCVVNGMQCLVDDSCTDADQDGETDESPVWSAWSYCENIDECGVGTQSRMTTVIQRQRGMGAACPPLVDYRPCNATTDGALAPAGIATGDSDQMECFNEPVLGHRYEGLSSSGSYASRHNRVGSEIAIDVDGYCTESSTRVCSTSEATEEELRSMCAGLCTAEPECESANFRYSGSGSSAVVKCNMYSGTIGGGTNPGQDGESSTYTYLERLPASDCEYEWSPWSACSEDCADAWPGGPQRFRVLNVTTPGGCGGQACPQPVEFQRCVMCEDGERLIEDGSACEPCPTGWAGVGGDCWECPCDGDLCLVSDEGGLGCVPALPGQEPAPSGEEPAAGPSPQPGDAGEGTPEEPSTPAPSGEESTPAPPGEEESTPAGNVEETSPASTTPAAAASLSGRVVIKIAPLVATLGVMML